MYRAYFAPPDATVAEDGRLRVAGYGNVLLIRDLMTVLPEPGPEQALKLETIWQQQVNALSTGANTDAALEADALISAAIDDVRDAVSVILATLE